MTVDLRTDFTSRPTPRMVEAMMEAAREAPGFGLRDDPIVARLERLAADWLGKEDALFCPTCTMANQIAIHLRCRPGDSFAAEASSHVLWSEAGSPAALTGALPIAIPGQAGIMDPDLLRGRLHVGDSSRPRTSLIVVENTHVMSGGRVVPLGVMQQIRVIADERGISVHIDGARLVNAATHLRAAPSALAAFSDTVAVSLNKALAAPLGAVLAGSRCDIAEGVRIRQMFGGGWRPASIPAAAGIVAIESMAGRIAEDHWRAQELAEGLSSMSVVSVDPGAVETNIILARVNTRIISPEELVAELAKRDVLVLPFGSGAVRMCTSHEIDAAAVLHTLAAYRHVQDSRIA